MRILFTDMARRELEDGIRYYEYEYAGLGMKMRPRSVKWGSM